MNAVLPSRFDGLDGKPGLGQRLEIAADGPLGDAVAGLDLGLSQGQSAGSALQGEEQPPLADDFRVSFHG